MEIVIKIDEEKYKAITEMYGTFPKEMKDWGVDAIKNGTPLPEHHGDLIDRDALIYNADYYEPLISKRDVDFAPPIIEADKED